jgi:hypothetical protein
MFIKVVVVDQKRVQSKFEVNQVLAKAWFAPKDDSVDLAFKMDLPANPDYEELPSGLKPGDPTYQEVRDLISHLMLCSERRNGDALFESIYPILRSPPSYLGTREQSKRHSSSLIDAINSGKYRLITKLNDVTLVFGKRSVIAYSGVDDVLDPYLFKYQAEKGDDRLFLRAVLLVRLEGKWLSR